MYVFICCEYAIGRLLCLTVDQYCRFCPYAGQAVPFAFDQKEPNLPAGRRESCQKITFAFFQYGGLARLTDF